LEAPLGRRIHFSPFGFLIVAPALRPGGQGQGPAAWPIGHPCPPGTPVLAWPRPKGEKIRMEDG